VLLKEQLPRASFIAFLRNKWVDQKDPVCYNIDMMKITEDIVQAEKQRVFNLLKGPQFERGRHGSLWDRGSADSYYHRGPQPHWWPQGTGHGEKITDLTAEERAEYMAGYQDNEQSGDKKDWG
jgi:hypothetical protein